MSISHCCCVSEEVFRIIDCVLNYAAEHVRMIICDGEGCNSLIKNVIQGCLAPEHRRRLHTLPFLSNVSYRDVEGLGELPRGCPKLCLVNGRLLYGLPAAAHACKNASAQLLAEGKVLYFGKYWADPTGALEYSLPVPAYSRKDAAWFKHVGWALVKTMRVTQFQSGWIWLDLVGIFLALWYYLDHCWSIWDLDESWESFGIFCTFVVVIPRLLLVLKNLRVS